MKLNRPSPFLPALLIGSAFLACGGISDPSKSGAGANIATVSGALSGTAVPADAHVAVVWLKGAEGGYAIGADAPIIDGKFTLNVAPPPDSYLLAASNGAGPPNIAAGEDPRPDDAPPTPPSPSPNPGGKSIRTMGNVGGMITGELRGAVAGFVVYQDANGNHALDLEGEHAGSPDTILGGNHELMLAFLSGGGQLDYEKLRDSSGILPHAGFNLVWDGRRDLRWLGLNLVELKITSETRLPGPVCSYGGGGASGGGGGSGGSAGSEVPPTEPVPAPDRDGGAAGGGGPTYPPPGAPDLFCSQDGSFYTYGRCEGPPPPPPGLCSYGRDSVAPCMRNMTFRPDPIPSDWPCPDTIHPPPLDGGSP